jgi:hypothetical protein
MNSLSCQVSKPKVLKIIEKARASEVTGWNIVASSPLLNLMMLLLMFLTITILTQ